MISTSTLAFLSSLKENNNKEWFNSHKSEYQKARKDFLRVVSLLIEGVAAFDTSVADANLAANKCIMRINRDIRFSKDKTPYKSNFFGVLSKGGKKSPYAAYYLNIEPHACFVGGGIYMPPNEVLRVTRQEIDYNLEEWKAIVEAPSFRHVFPDGIQPSGKLKRPPKGYSEENAAIEYLKFKGYYTQAFLEDQEVCSDSFIPKVLDVFKAQKPLIDFLNRSIEDLEQSED